MTPEELAAIKARYDKNWARHDAGLGTFRCCSGCRDADEIPALLAYVDELEEQGSKLTREADLRLRAETSDDARDLLAAHDWDELIFGGFICLTCTPDECDDPDDNVAWPCPPLRAAGVTLLHAEALIKLHRAEVDLKAARKRIAELESRPVSAPPGLDPRTAPKGYPLGWTQHVLEEEARATRYADAEREADEQIDRAIAFHQYPSPITTTAPVFGPHGATFNTSHGYWRPWHPGCEDCVASLGPKGQFYEPGQVEQMDAELTRHRAEAGIADEDGPSDFQAGSWS